MSYGWFGNSMPEKNLSLDEFLDFDGVLEDYSTRKESNSKRHYESEETKQSVQEEDPHDSISPPSGLSYDEDPLLPHPEELHEGCITDLEWVSRIVEDSNFISPELISPNTFAPISNKGGFRNKSWAKKFWLPFSMEALHVATGRRGKRRPKSGPIIWMDSQLMASSSFLVEAKQKHESAPNPEPVEAVVDVGLVQRCSHCGVENTPQWRTGPLGAKTLCNACGVRYKSGRLLPEYRPAASPTFIDQVHSNSHRKVLEMRRQKGLVPRALSRSTVGSSGSAMVRFEPGPDGWAGP